MQVFDKVADQIQSVGLPVVAVSLTAVPRANTAGVADAALAWICQTPSPPIGYCCTA